MTIQSYTNSIGSMGWDIFTLFTFETWLFDEQSSFDIIVLLLRISCIDEELNSWKRVSLQKQRHLVDIWCMRWTAAILFQFLFPQLFASDFRGDVTGAILSRRLFRTFLLRMEFLDSGSQYYHHQLRRIFVKTGMVMMKKSGVSCRPPSLSFSNLFFRLTFDFLPRWPPRCLNTYPASRR